MTYAIRIQNQTDVERLVQNLLEGHWESFDPVKKERTGIFSIKEIARFIEEEEIHDIKKLTAHTKQSLKSMSSGERKNALLQYLMHQGAETLILVNPYDHLDTEKAIALKTQLEHISKTVNLVQLLTRASDVLDATQHFYFFQLNQLKPLSSRDEFLNAGTFQKTSGKIPAALTSIKLDLENLVSFKNINVSFDDRQVLKDINWDIKKGDFWQLKGPNGSGKSTLLNMITGESHKGYGQDLTLFGRKKGSGESVWDIKELLGYFTPAMVDRFRGYHSIENMLISGLHDSVGLYRKPTDKEKILAHKWLAVLQMEAKGHHYFHQLSQGEKRLVMTARAMIKHPPLLILDEPTAGLDDRSAAFFVNLVNQFASQSKSAVVFVSHRTEKGLTPQKVFELFPKENGSEGKIHYI